MAEDDPSPERVFSQKAPGEPLTSNTIFTKPQPTPGQLLALLNRHNNSNQLDASARTALTARLRSASPTEPFTQLAALAQRQPTQLQQSDSQEEMSPATAAKQDSESTLSVGDTPQEAANNDSIHTRTSQSADPSHDNSMQKLARQCDWMQDINLTREEFRSDHNQAHLLQKEESWQKPAPGKSFPAGNIPISILTMLQRLADEDAASGAQPDSDDEMEEDSTPDSIESIEDVLASETELNQGAALLQDPPASNLVLWSITPSPPKPPTRVVQTLPPDSSFDHGHASDTPPHTPRPEIPPSSPPTRSPHEDTDEDIEMESYIPQALGDDIPDSPLRSKKGPSKPSSISYGVVVQVKETPHSKERNLPVQTTVRQAETAYEKSHNTPKLSLSRSVVLATYESSPSATGNEASTPPRDPTAHKNGAHMEHQLGNATTPTTPRIPDADELQSLRIVNSSTPPYISGSSKRKFHLSPSKKTQKSKRQEIKHGNFGEGATSSADPALDFQRHREESFRKFKETRRPQKRSTNSDDVEAATKGKTNSSPEPDASNTNSPRRSPRHQRAQDLGAIDRKQATDHVLVTNTHGGIAVGQDDRAEDQQTPPNGFLHTIFAEFKAAYPDYVGDERHFAGQCHQIYMHDMEDRMVSKWQWDDYIIRNLTVYRPYVSDCLAHGVDHVNWLPYYKDHVLDTVYDKHVIMNRETLVQACNELDPGIFEREQLPGPLTSVANGSNDTLHSALAHHDDNRDTKSGAQVLRPPRRSSGFGRTRAPLAQALDARRDASPERIDPFRSFLLASAGRTPLRGNTNAPRRSASGGGGRPN